MIQTGLISLTFNFMNIGTDVGFGTPSDPAVLPFPDINWSPGSGANQANKVYKASRTLDAGANETLTLTDGSLLDAWGNPVTFASVKAIAIYNTSTGTLTLTAGTGVAGGWTAFQNGTAGGAGQRFIGPGGLDVNVNPSASGIAVPSGGGIRVDNGGSGSANYYIEIVGI